MDIYDKKILFELDKNARITTAQLGKKIRRSKQFVDYRITRLEEQEIIKGYMAVIDYGRLGYQSVRVYFSFRNITPKEQADLENELIQDKEVWWLVTLEGVWDVGYAVAIKSMFDFYTYWDKLMAKYKRFIHKSSVVVYTHIKQYPKSYIVNKKNTHQGTQVGSFLASEPVDELDMNIMNILSTNGRIPLLHLASQCKTSPQVIKYRMKKLEHKNILQGYRALIDVSHLGYRYYKSYIRLLHTDNLETLHQFCLEHPNILNVNRTIGGHDFEMELQAKSFEEFDDIMKKIRSEFSGMIDTYEFVIAREEKKMNYFPF